jgi:hypothetical protein
MHILYFFQGQLGESEEDPNAFLIPGSVPITFGSFLKHFPIKTTDLHFRFRAEDSDFGFVWIDISSHDEKLPVGKDQLIIAKVLKLDVESVTKRARILKLKSKETLKNLGNQQNASNIPYKDPKPVSAEVFSNHKHAQSPRPRYSDDGPVRDDVPDSKGGDGDVFQETPDSIFDSGDTADDIDDSSNQPPPVSSNFDDELNAISAAAPPPPPVAEVKLDRYELIAKKNDKIKEQVQDALDFKKELDNKKETEALEFDAARTKYEAKIMIWSTVNGNEKRNVRSLLSSMHTVVWEGCRWKHIGLGDLLEPKQVKLQYRKAMLIVHTDKTPHEPVYVRFIAKRCFEAINEAYEEFLKKERV